MQTIYSSSNYVFYTVKSFVLTAFFLSLFVTVIQAQTSSADESPDFKQKRGFYSEFLEDQFSENQQRQSSTNRQNLNSALGSRVDSTFNASVTEGYGYINETVVQPDGKIIAVGSFQLSSENSMSAGIARFNADGSLDTSFDAGSGANSYIRAVALQADGKIIVVGNFTSFNGQPVRRIVRLNANGSIDQSFSTSFNFNNQINDVLILPDGKILVGGSFSFSSSFPSKLIRLNTDGTYEAGFPEVINTIYKIVYTADNKLLLGGSSYGVKAIRRINLDGTPDETFNANLDQSGVVFDIAVQSDGKIIIGGHFEEFNGIASDSIARLNADGSLDTAYQIPGLPDSAYIAINALAVQNNDKLVVGYRWSSDIYKNAVIRFNNDGTPDTSFNSGDTKSELILNINPLDDGNLLVSGSFVFYNNQTHRRVVKINSDGVVDSSFDSNLSTLGSVYEIKRQADGKIIIGGSFNFVNGSKRYGIARLNSDGTLDNSFNPDIDFYGYVRTMLILPDGKIIAGGTFVGTYDNNTVNALVKINSDGSFAQSFETANNDNFVIYAYSLAMQSNGKLLLGGYTVNAITTYNTTPIRFNADGSMDSTFARYDNFGFVYSMVVQPDDKVIIGGTFGNLASQSRIGIARLNSDGKLNDAFNFQRAGGIYALAQQPDGKILLGGGFTLARYSADGVLDQTFNAGTGIDANLWTIKIQPDGKILIGGNPNTYNGTPVNKFARINPDGSLDTSFNTGSGTSGVVLASETQPDKKILVGGQFLNFDGTQKFSLVRLTDSASQTKTPFDFDGDGKSDVSVFRPSNGAWYLNQSTNGFTGVTFGAGTDQIAPADFDGDGKTDISVFRNGAWYYLRSSDGAFVGTTFGQTGDVPIPADFDGDGKSDINVFRPSNGAWYRLNSSTGAFFGITFGQNGDKPLVADFDGDGKSDIAVFRPSNGTFYSLDSSNGAFRATQFGLGTDIPTMGDFDGDGKTDVAVFRPSNGAWYRYNSSTGEFFGIGFGQNGDIPVTGDYDGDNKADIAVFRPSNGAWYYLKSSNGGFVGFGFGVSTDKPIPAAFQ